MNNSEHKVYYFQECTFRIRSSMTLFTAIAVLLLGFGSLSSQVYPEELHFHKNLTLHDHDKIDLPVLVSQFNSQATESQFRFKSNQSYVHDSTIYYSGELQGSPLIPFLKLKHLYDGNREINLNSYYIPETEQWVEHHYQVFRYNNDNQLIEYTRVDISGDYTGFPEINPTFKSYYSYDEEDRLILYESYNPEDLEINVVGKRLIYEYTSEGLLQTVTDFDRNLSNDTISPFKQTFYRYDDMGNQSVPMLVNYSEYTYCKLSNCEQNWYLSDSSNISYNNAMMVDSIMMFRRSPNEATELFGINVREYGGDLVQDEYLIRFFDSGFGDNEWENHKHRHFDYTASNNIQSMIVTDSLTFTGQFKVDQEVYYEYDESVLINDIKRHRALNFPGFSDFVESNPSHMLLEHTENYWETNQASFRLKYFYSKTNESTSTTQVFQNKSLVVYPVPSEDFIYVQFEEKYDIVKVVISNQLGQVLIRKDYTTNQGLDISSLKSGIYICSVFHNGQVYNQQFVKL